MSLKFLTRKDLLALTSFTKNRYETDGINTTNSTIGVCKKKYPFRGIAHVLTKTHGDVYCYYPPEVNFLEGDTVEILISMGIPSIHRKVSYGFENGKALYLDIYSKDKRIGTVDEEHDVPQEVEKLSLNEVSYVSDVPHKVFALGLNGLDVRYESATLFSHSGTKVEVSRNKVAFIARNFQSIAPGGQDVLFDNNGSPFRTRTTTQKDDEGNMAPLWQELTGDIRSALKGIGISNIAIPSKIFNIDKAIKVDVLFGDDISKYELNPKTVSHTYINRKLSVSNEASGEDIVVNKALLPTLGFSLDSIKYSCGIAIRNNGKEIPVLYIKAIMMSGDTVEYSAGVKEEVNVTSSKVTLLEDKAITLGKKTEIMQKGKTTLEYPVSTKSKIFSDVYSSSILLNKGDMTIMNYRPIKESRIQASVDYQVDQESEIKTYLQESVPVRVTTVVDDTLVLKKHKDLKNTEVKYSVVGQDAGDSLYFAMDLKKSTFIYKGESSAGDSSLFISPAYGKLETSGALYFKTKSAIIDAETIINKGLAVFKKGLYSDGKFTVQSDDIFLVAANTLQLGGNNVYTVAKNNIMSIYEKTCSISSSKRVVLEDRTTAVPGTLIMGETDVRFQGEKVLGYGASSIVMVAKLNATFGAEKTVLYGVDQ